MFIDIPDSSQEIMTRLYQYMLGNRFLSYNASKSEHKSLYRFVDKNLTELNKYYDPIGYIIISGENYFYWKEYRPLTEAELVKELKHIEKMYLCIDFLIHFDSTISENSVLRINRMVSFVDDNPPALDRLRFLTQKKNNESVYALTTQLLQILQQAGLVELHGTQSEGRYKVLSSYRHYMELSKMIESDKEEFGYGE